MGKLGKMFIKNTKYEILTPEGFKPFSGIRMKEENTIKFSFSNNRPIEVTEDHQFGNYIAEDLKVDDTIPSMDGNTQITKIEVMKDTKKVYDPVDVKDHLYIGNGIINHNCDFIGSTHTVIDSDTLEEIIVEWEEPKYTELSNTFLIYEKPITGCNYVLGVDTAKGTGEHYSAVQVLKIESLKPIKMTQVAVLIDNTIDVYTFADAVNRMSYYYNNAYIMVENNAEGAAVVSRLWWEHENENLVNTGSKAVNLGVRATRATKPKAVLLMKKLIEDRSLKIVDKETLEELTTFVEEGNKFFGKDKPDDAVSALYWACYILEMNILDESFEFEKEKEEDGWGVLTDLNPQEQEWGWLYEKTFKD